MLARELEAADCAWASGRAPEVGARFAAKTRYRQADAACTVVAAEADRIALRFDQPQWAVTPGQSAVLYAGEVCLGGGVIEATLPLVAAHDLPLAATAT
jgi:tRNA-specific 2-thiouridylase